MRLYDKIMSIRCDVDANMPIGCGEAMAYRHGHSDAQLAAAEAAISADAAISVLRALDDRLRSCIALGLSAAEAYDSGYKEDTAEVLMRWHQ